MTQKPILLFAACYVALVLLCSAPAKAQDATTIKRAVALLKKLPPQASLAQARKLLPKGTKYGPRQTTSLIGWTWITQPFRGPLNGQFVFANRRKLPTRKPGAPPPPPFSPAQILQKGDSLHYVEIFLGADNKSDKKGALTAFTKRYVAALSKSLGKPSKTENTGEEGGPEAEGWTAAWKFSGGRLIEFRDSFPLLADGPRPMLTLEFPYSQIYKS